MQDSENLKKTILQSTVKYLAILVFKRSRNLLRKSYRDCADS